MEWRADWAGPLAEALETVREAREEIQLAQGRVLTRELAETYGLLCVAEGAIRRILEGVK